MLDFATAMHIASTGLSAQRVRMNVISSNLANVETTRTAEGGPYRRRDPVFQSIPMHYEFDRLMGDQMGDQVRTVRVAEIRATQGEPRRVYDPEHPDSDIDGYVEMPDINVVEEMVNMITASRTYEANVTAVQTLKSMSARALMIGS